MKAAAPLPTISPGHAPTPSKRSHYVTSMSKGDKSLIQAAGKGHLDQLINLICMGIDVNKEKGGKTALSEAVRNGCLESVDILLRNGARVNLPHNKETPLMLALKKHGRNEVVKTLMSRCEPVQDSILFNGRSHLMFAAMGGYSDAGLTLLRNARDPHEALSRQCPKFHTVLTHAARNGHVKFIRDVVLPHFNFSNPITQAVASEDARQLKNVLKATKRRDLKTSLNTAKDFEVTALTLCAILGLEKFMQILLDAGACPNVIDACGRHALIYAAACGNSKCLDILVSVGAVLSWPDRQSRSALMYASRNGNVDCVRILIEALKSEVPEDNAREFDILDTDTCSPKFAVVSKVAGQEYCRIVIIPDTNDNGRLRVPEQRREAAVDWDLPRPLRGSLNDTDQGFKTALKMASKRGSLGCVHHLLHAGVEPDVEQFNFYLGTTMLVTPLMLASSRGYIDVASELVRANADVDSADHQGNTALFYAVEGDQGAMVQWLLEQGARATRKNKAGRSPFIIAAGQGHTLALASLVFHKKQHSLSHLRTQGKKVFLEAARNGQTMCMMLLIQAGINIYGREPYGLEAAVEALHGCHIRVLEYLFNKLRIPINPVNLKQHSPLAIACRDETPLRIIRFLIDSGSDVNRVDMDTKTTPLMFACERGYPEAVKLLLESGSATDIRDSNERTALALAVQGGNANCLMLIIAAVRREPETDAMWKTVQRAFHLAVEMGRGECIETFARNRMFSWLWHFCIFRVRQEHTNIFLSSLVKSSVSPGCFRSRNSQLSPFRLALYDMNFGLVKFLLINLYLTHDDFTSLPRDKYLHRRAMSMPITSEDSYVVRTIFTKPWPLSTLSLLTISASLKGGMGVTRDRIVDDLPLPPCFKRKLAFREVYSQICPEYWRYLVHEPWCPLEDDFMLSAVNRSVWWELHLKPCVKLGCRCKGKKLMMTNRQTPRIVV